MPQNSPTQPLHQKWWVWLVAALVLLWGVGLVEDDSPAPADDTALAEAAGTPTTATTAEPTPTPEPTAILLFVTDQKDGDSWVASDGEEYRLGLVNTPERNEPCGSEATAFTRDFLADGFTTDTYASDTYGRQVAEVFDADGESLNVALAESGLGDDRFLDEFRHENPDLAERLETALADAPTPDCRASSQPRGFAAAAPTTKAPKPKKPASDTSRNDCMSGYSPCLPIVSDLNCPQVPGPVKVTGGDPYGLDRDGDGIGCDT